MQESDEFQEEKNEHVRKKLCLCPRYSTKSLRKQTQRSGGENTAKIGQKNTTACYYFIVGSKSHNNFKVENSIGILILL